MPGLDRKGPAGQGARTGRGLGKCRTPENRDQHISENAHDASVERKGPGGGKGQGRGEGRGEGRGLGRGQGKGRAVRRQDRRRERLD